MKSNYDVKIFFDKLSLGEKVAALKSLYGEDFLRKGSITVTGKMRRDVYNHLKK